MLFFFDVDEKKILNSENISKSYMILRKLKNEDAPKCIGITNSNFRRTQSKN